MPTQDLSCLCAQLWAVENFSPTRVQDFLDRGSPGVASWLNELLLYDRCVVPVQDYLVPCVLTTHFGEAAIIDLLESTTLSFVRVLGGVGYAAPGTAGSKTGGFCTFIHPAYGQPPGSPTLPSIERMVDKAATALRDALGRAPDPRLIALFKERTTTVDPRDFVDEVGARVLDELSSDSGLRDWTGTRMSSDSLQLPGPAGRLTVYSGAISKGLFTETDRLAALMGANLELYIAAAIGAGDLSTTGPIEAVLARRAMKHLSASAIGEAFAKTRELWGVADIGALVFTQPTRLSPLLKLRDAREGQQFRKWFHANARSGDPDTLAKALVDLSRRLDTVATFPSRVLRFLITTALAVIPPIGVAASAMDSLVVERLFRDRSAKLFLDKLAKQSGKEQP